jgi:hypothetical protein
MKSLFRLPTLFLAIVVEIATISILPATSATGVRVSAPTQSSIFDRSGTLEARVTYRPTRKRRRFPRKGAPRVSTGGAVRGGCFIGNGKKEAPLVPLMPIAHDDALTGVEPDKKLVFFGSTISERPTFLAYVPQTKARQINFLLQEQESEDEWRVVYEKTIEIDGNPKIISIKLDNAATPLVIGKNYIWDFTTICDPIDRSSNPTTSGITQRLEPSPALSSRLSKVAMRDRPNLYAEDGAWLDSLSTLAQLRCSKPTDATLRADWSELLKAMELEKVPQVVKQGDVALLAQLIKSGQIEKAPLAQCGR